MQVNRFSATNRSEAVVRADREVVWAVLTDPELLPKLTPLLQRIDADGDLWTWHMRRIAALGVSIVPAFTERMTFDEGNRIDYTHEAPRGVRERAGAEGWYVLTDVADGTKLQIQLTLSVDLPLPKAAAPAVQRVMSSMMARTGQRFSANLLRQLEVAAPARKRR